MGMVFELLATTSALELAFDRVRQNAGCAGVGGESIEQFAADLPRHLEVLQAQLRAGTYTPGPLLGVEIRKKHGGLRTLAIPSVRDRVAQEAAVIVVGPILDAEFSECSHAYRPAHSVNSAVRAVLQLRDLGYKWVLDADIDHYFDSIPHDALLSKFAERVPDSQVQRLVRAWLSPDIVTAGARAPRTRGVPQGSPLSPLLANLYLDDFDDELRGHGLHLVRYADDFLVLCKNRPAATRALDITREALQRLKLNLHTDKTRVTDFDHGFRFLGVEFLRQMAFRPVFEETTDDVSKASPPAPPAGLSEPCTVVCAPSAALGPEDVAAPPTADAPSATHTPQPDSDAPDEDSEVTPLGGEPGLQTLYVLTQGAVIAKESERFVVRVGHEIKQEVAALHVDQVVVLGRVHMTTPAMQFCLRRGVPVYFLSNQGRFFGILHDRPPGSVDLLRRQLAACADPSFTVAIARAIVRGKLSNQVLALRRWHRVDARPELEVAIGEAQPLLDRLDRCVSLDEVRGVEGAGAAAYFRAWTALLRPQWGFMGRRRRPPPDPVNSLLSFGYTLLYYNAHSALRVSGLDPRAGFLHTPRSGQEALVSDLIEEFRAPVVDGTVLRVLRSGRIGAADFVTRPGNPSGCFMTPEARRVFIPALEATFNRCVLAGNGVTPTDYRRHLARQAAQVAESVRVGRPMYQPFVLR